MAMIELEDSDEINIEKCRTDGETLLKGKGLTKVDVFDSEALKSQKPVAEPQEDASKLLSRSLSWIMGIVATVIAAGICAWLGFS